MANSITDAGGIIDPILVRPADSGKYEIVQGEVRWLAALQLKMDIVPIRVVHFEAEAVASLIANVERESISPEEIISGLERLVAEFGVDASEDVAKQLPSLREVSSFTPELEERIKALLRRCGIEHLID